MRHARILAATVCVFAFASGAIAAQGEPPAKAASDADTLVTAQQLQTLLQSAGVAKDTGKPAEVSTQLFPGVASCSFIRLVEPDAPHVHPVSEIYVMQQGSGTLETGGTMLGPFTAGGVHHMAVGATPQQTPDSIGPDHGGSALTGATITQEVHAGDVIMVPAGVNHHWTKITQPLVYLDIKFPKT